MKSALLGRFAPLIHEKGNIMTYRKTDVTLQFRINRHIMAALQKLADRDPGVDVAIICRRAIMRELGMEQPALNLWEAGEREERHFSISRGAAALIRKSLELSPEEIAEMDDLQKEYIDELQSKLVAYNDDLRSRNPTPVL